MPQTTIDQIKNIVENLDFEGPDRLRVKVDKMVYQFKHPSNGESSELQDGLSNVIYSEFYCATETGKLPEPTYEDRVQFVKKLRTANASQDKLHRGWKVDNILPNGKVYASKGNYHQQVSPGDYVRSSMSEAVAKGSEISIYQHKEYDNKEEVFFFIFGETLTETATPGLVRFYFNAQPKGSIALVKNLSTYFNQYQIPFQFKCLNQPAFYNRTDSAVLYISKNHADFAWEVICKFYPEIKDLLNPALPYFAKYLAPGIGFAENPHREKESFGQSRSRIIAEAIVKAHDQGMPKAEWVPLILKNIERKGLDVERFYLNAKSYYPYGLVAMA